LSSLSTTDLLNVRSILARALSVEDVNDLGRSTGQAERLRTATPHRLFLAIVSTLAGAKVESLADLLRAFAYQNGVHVARKAFYNRLASLAARKRQPAGSQLGCGVLDAYNECAAGPGISSPDGIGCGP